ncbi:MAG: helix-turn-helix transcriptional regulator [Caldiserica bacterium]|jgi:transcriptional regulator with XRE-family HTH domain|nr:helix-turn-helix transcriptional regulator [Caldisericota bacterium]
MGFKENVEVLLSRSHWSQRHLGAAAGISSGRVSQILSNPTSPTLATVTKIAAAFGLEAADLVRDEMLSAPGDELEVALRHQGDLNSEDIQAVHAFIAYIRGARPKGNRRGK